MENNNKSKQEIKREYRERQKPAGVFRVKNKVNGKFLLGSSLNLEGPLNGLKFMLKTGSYRNDALQEDWKTFGEENFVFEVLEEVQIKDDLYFNLQDELTLLEEIWIEKLHPFDGTGYNKGTKIRQA